MKMAKGCCIWIAAAVALCLGGGVRAQTPAEFYKGKDVRLLISHPAGGGMDAYARFFARNLSKFLVGHPHIMPQNMPGAAGIVMANSMATQQRADGTVIAIGPGAIATADIFGLHGARFNAGKFSWIGSMNADTGVALAWSTAPVKKAADLFKAELIVGGGGATDQSVIYPTAVNRILETKFKIIGGYAGSAAIDLAMESGEVSGIGGINFSSILANRPGWLKDHKVNVLMQYSTTRAADLANVPTVLELAKTEEQRQILTLIFSPSKISRLIFAPPGVPADRLQALRTAFNKMMRDKRFLAEAQKSKIEINMPMPGADIKKLVDKLRSTKPAVIKGAMKAMRLGN